MGRSPTYLTNAPRRRQLCGNPQRQTDSLLRPVYTDSVWVCVRCHNDEDASMVIRVKRMIRNSNAFSNGYEETAERSRVAIAWCLMTWDKFEHVCERSKAIQELENGVPLEQDSSSTDDSQS